MGSRLRGNDKESIMASLEWSTTDLPKRHGIPLGRDTARHAACLVNPFPRLRGKVRMGGGGRRKSAIDSR